ncbi:hypothetical protein KL86DPRO_11675 [uncultured delta proteobacterium]|uniref:Uncharacterized protein n=1 Tax=uncultured delta proteobacterium TaxID=34034 RepID=A0A212JK69_9DELT|nr:hypothetical protein KL86DPRO_11675 [uncultured delta proteobacterium]
MKGRNVKKISPLFDITVRRVGIVARDYNVRFPNGYRDFSHALPGVLALLDEKGCDTALFSLYSIIPRQGYDILPTLPNFANLKMICLEEFRDCRTGRKAGHYVVYYRAPDGWEEYRFTQAFGRVNWQTQSEEVRQFAQEQIPRRMFGNSCIIVCGESNGAKFDKKNSRKVIDPCGVRAAIPTAHIILNPVHDRMSRFEMMLKRRFLSEGGRWVISVWNRGKLDKNGRTRDGANPPWTVFYDGEAVHITKVTNSLGVDIGYLEVATFS